MSRLRSRFQVSSMVQTMKSLREWHRSPVGELMIEDQRHALSEPVAKMFGYDLLEMSLFDGPSLIEDSPISRRWRMSPIEGEGIDTLARFDQLPYANDTFDVVVLHHVLEYSRNPHQLLKEATRVLVPKGHLIVFGFNPYSFFGLARWLGRPFRSSRFWQRHSFSKQRLEDWVRLLDCEPIEHRWGFFLPPIQKRSVLKKMRRINELSPSERIPLGGYHMVIARKDVFAMTMIKPSKFKMAPIGQWVGAAPSTRAMTRHSHSGDLKSGHLKIVKSKI